MKDEIKNLKKRIRKLTAERDRYLDALLIIYNSDEMDMAEYISLVEDVAKQAVEGKG